MFSQPKKQTQNKPNLVRRRRIPNERKIARRKIRPNPKKLDLGLSLIILLTIFNMPSKRQRFGFPQDGGPYNAVVYNEIGNDCKTGHTQRRIGFGD